jgi:hypothetical protein
MLPGYFHLNLQNSRGCGCLRDYAPRKAGLSSTSWTARWTTSQSFRCGQPGPADREGCGRRVRDAEESAPWAEASADHRRGAVTGDLRTLMAEIEPGLSAEAVLGALERAAARQDGQHRIAAAVTAQPGLLTGEGARAPVPGVLRFISALACAGATSVVEPPCPRCCRRRQLGVPVEVLRLCARCRSKARAVPCGRCGKIRQPHGARHHRARRVGRRRPAGHARSGVGRIVNVPSGIIDRPGSMVDGNASAATKAALEAHTVNLAEELRGTGAWLTPTGPGEWTRRCRRGSAGRTRTASGPRCTRGSTRASPRAPWSRLGSPPLR